MSSISDSSVASVEGFDILSPSLGTSNILADTLSAVILFVALLFVAFFRFFLLDLDSVTRQMLMKKIVFTAYTCKGPQ